MLPWEVASYGHVYTTSPWALYLVVAALLAALGGVAIAILPAPGTPDDYPLEGLGRLSFGSAVAGLCFIAAPVLAWWLSDDPLSGGGEARTYMVFQRLLRLEVFWAAATALVTTLALAVMRRRKVAEKFARVGALVSMASLGLGGLVAAHATLLVEVDCLPRIDKVGHGYLQMGRARLLAFRTSCGPQYTPPAPTEVLATAPGELAVPVELDSPLVHISRVIPLMAGEESGPERLAIREGNRWVYLYTEVSRMRGRSNAERDNISDRVTIEVGQARLDNGLQIFPLTLSSGSAKEPERYEVLGWNGSLERYEEGQMKTLIAPGPLRDITTDFLLPGKCQGAPAEGIPSAPAECRVPVGVASGLGAAMLRIFTLGSATYLPGRETYLLEEGTWGPEGGPEIPRKASP